MDRDTTQDATAARILDALRGGSNNGEADRRAAAELKEAFPDAEGTLRWWGRFSSSAAAAAARSGMSGAVFAGTGFPFGVPPHLAMPGHGRAPWAVYADGAAAVTSARAVALEGDSSAVAVQGCPEKPGDVMKAVTGLGLPRGPVHAQVGTVLAGLAAPDATELLYLWAELLGPGSQVAFLVPVRKYLCFPQYAAYVPDHGPHDAAAWVAGAGLDLVRMADVRAWDRQDWEDDAVALGDDTRMVAVVAAKRG